MAEMWCNLNGEEIRYADAGLPLKDLGIVRGYGVFDYMRTYNGVPLLLDEHVDRLFNSAKLINLPVPYTKQQISAFVLSLLAKNAWPESHIKIIVTGGPSDDGITVDAPSFFILTTPHTPLPETLFTDGIQVMTHEHLRIFPEAKTLNYVTAIALQKQKRETGAYEIIYTHRGHVLEATTSNVFLVKDGKLITPKRDILDGVTRQAVIRLAQQSYPVEERHVTTEELLSADEVFLTASNKEVMPVVRIDDTTIGNGKPGPHTHTIREMYMEFVKQQTTA